MDSICIHPCFQGPIDNCIAPAFPLPPSWHSFDMVLVRYLVSIHSDILVRIEISLRTEDAPQTSGHPLIDGLKDAKCKHTAEKLVDEPA